MRIQSTVHICTAVCQQVPVGLKQCPTVIKPVALAVIELCLYEAPGNFIKIKTIQFTNTQIVMLVSGHIFALKSVIFNIQNYHTVV